MVQVASLVMQERRFLLTRPTAFAYGHFQEPKITNTGSISLTGDFAAYVDQFDFASFKAKPVREII
ncbi:MAG: hypothetical protein ACLPKT_06930, partial [Methylocella sp.]